MKIQTEEEEWFLILSYTEFDVMVDALAKESAFLWARFGLGWSEGSGSPLADLCRPFPKRTSVIESQESPA